MSDYTSAEHLGVQFISADAPQAQSLDRVHTLSSSHGVPSISLGSMLPDWVKQFHDAAQKVNGKQLLALIAQIPQEQSEVAEALSNMVENFQFEDLVALSQPESVSENQG